MSSTTGTSERGATSVAVTMAVMSTFIRHPNVKLGLLLVMAAALFLFAGLAGCREEIPATVSSTAQAPTEAALTTPVLPAPTAGELHSDKDRSVPSVGPADLGELVRGNNAFAFDLYHALSGREGNLFYSPFSISQALAMTSA